MERSEIVEKISRGRTEYIIEFMKLPDWKSSLNEGQVKPLQWLIYYNDLTGLKLVEENGGSLESLNLNDELGNASFFGHWKICEFLIKRGADVNCFVDKTKETPLHNALSKAGRWARTQI